MFANYKLVHDCIQSQSEDDSFLPVAGSDIKKLYVRQCYQDVFKLLLEFIDIGRKKFAISGTPGIGKSLFFVYILYRLLEDRSQKNLSLNPVRIVYHAENQFCCYDLEKLIVTNLAPTQDEADKFLFQTDTLYILDGKTNYYPSSCIALFIASPRSDHFQHFVNQTKAMSWYFPVWTLNELVTCRQLCYENLEPEELDRRYQICGGVARFVFHRYYDKKIIEMALNDAKAARGVRYVGSTTSIYKDSHKLLQMMVGVDDRGYDYQYIGLDVASKYIGEQLWLRHTAQMINNLQDMFGGGPNQISRHLFEIYGHKVFSIGNKRLKCRCLESGVEEDFTLDDLGSERTTFGKDTIPTRADLTGKYYEASDDQNFPAIDSLSHQGMFQFTVAAEHPIAGVSTLKELCALYDEPKLYFVVPPYRFEWFRKQSFKSGNVRSNDDKIPGLKQYVLELPVVEHFAVLRPSQSN